MKTRMIAMLACGALLACAQGSMIASSPPDVKWESPPPAAAERVSEKMPAMIFYVKCESNVREVAPVLSFELAAGGLEEMVPELVPPPGCLVKVEPGEGELPAVVTAWPEAISRPPHPLFKVRWHGGRAVAMLHDEGAGLGRG